jgi:hypothetical protein
MPALQEIFRSMKPVLKIDWATHEAARYACENWHYSQSIPKSKLVKIGVWENQKFIGVVIFSPGATPNLGSPYGLTQRECVELSRIALTRHFTPVSRILSIALKFLISANPKLRLVVSFADRDQSHHGGIYQATNWIYDGTGSPATFYLINGKKTHPRTIGLAGHIQNLQGAKKMDCNAKSIQCQGKHRYLMPLDNEMRKQIIPLAKPYPKRASSETIDTPGIHPGKGGETPTDALHSANK